MGITEEFAIRLKKEISKGLPGTEVQWELSSSIRRLRGIMGTPGDNTIAAGVLILLYPKNNRISTVFIQRPDYEGVHGGQISFPGGKQEISDRDLIMTALRESSEEIGIYTEEVNIISSLTPLFIPVSNTLVTPVVGWMEKPPDFRLQEEEVLFVIEADLSTLLEPGIIKTKPQIIRGEMFDIRYFSFEGHTIWGATAMLLHELLEIIRRGNLTGLV
jgi:8-oxo-dGTP pyrophosphatase MutT (NUDIX family)